MQTLKPELILISVSSTRTKNICTHLPSIVLGRDLSISRSMLNLVLSTTILTFVPGADLLEEDSEDCEARTVTSVKVLRVLALP